MGADDGHALTRCPACGAMLRGGWTCETAFHQALAWDYVNEHGAWQVHHLTVLCYHLQHPHDYSPEGLAWARIQIGKIIEQHLPPHDALLAVPGVAGSPEQGLFAAPGRKVKITSTPERYGAYLRQPAWTMTIIDCVSDGPQVYAERVRAWAASVHAALLDV